MTHTPIDGPRRIGLLASLIHYWDFIRDFRHLEDPVDQVKSRLNATAFAIISSVGFISLIVMQLTMIDTVKDYISTTILLIFNGLILTFLHKKKIGAMKAIQLLLCAVALLSFITAEESQILSGFHYWHYLLISVLFTTSSAKMLTIVYIVSSFGFLLTAYRIKLIFSRPGFLTSGIFEESLWKFLINGFLASLFTFLYCLALQHQERTVVKLMSKLWAQDKKLKQEAEQALASRNLVFNCMSHQLRNPLQMINGTLDVIRAKSSEISEHLLDSASVCCRLLLNMIDNILDRCHLELSNMVLSVGTRDMYQFLNELWMISSVLINQKQIQGDLTVQYHLPRFLNFDSEKLMQVLLNLVTNAVKYTKNGGRVQIKLSYEPKEQSETSKESTPPKCVNRRSRDASYLSNDFKTEFEEFVNVNAVPQFIHSRDGQSFRDTTFSRKADSPLNPQLKPGPQQHMRIFSTYSQGTTDVHSVFTEKTEEIPSPITLKIEVIDSGVGIDQSRKDSLFDPLHSLRKSNDNGGGIGLGLYISRQIILRMGGTLDFFETPGGAGTRFQILLPMEPVFHVQENNNNLVSYTSKRLIPQKATETNTSWPKFLALTKRKSDLFNLLPSLNANFELFDHPGKFVDHVGKILLPLNASGSKVCQLCLILDSNIPIDHSSLQNLLRKNSSDKLREVLLLHRGTPNDYGYSNGLFPGIHVTHYQSACSLIERLQFTYQELFDKKPCDYPSRTILIADDDQFNRRIMKSFASTINLNVLLAEDGRQALDLFRKHKDEISLVILDYEMPEIEGPELAAMMKADLESNHVYGTSQDIPIICLTGNTSEQHKSKCLSHGMKLVLTKPLMLWSFRTIVFELLKYES